MKKLIKYILIVFLLFQAHTAFGAQILKSIGTSGRDYSTITLWEADLDNAAVYASGDTALGECYNDSAFDEALITINGGTTIGLTAVTLSVASGQRHNGTAGTGARMVSSTGRTGGFSLVPVGAGNTLTIEWLEYNANGQAFSGAVISASAATNGRVPVIKQMLVHDMVTTTGSLFMVGGSARDVLVMNTIIYDMAASGGNSRMSRGIFYAGNQASGGVFNNTIYKMSATGGFTTQDAIGVDITNDNANKRMRNNIAMNMSASGTGTAADFRFGVGVANGTASNNMSDDATADDQGSGSLINKSAATQFVSTTNGSEDFHLITGSDAINTGVDLVTTPTGVQFDIDNYDRDTTGVVWDIGADEFVAAPSPGGTVAGLIMTLVGAVMTTMGAIITSQ